MTIQLREVSNLRARKTAKSATQTQFTSLNLIGHFTGFGLTVTMSHIAQQSHEVVTRESAGLSPFHATVGAGYNNANLNRRRKSDPAVIQIMGRKKAGSK